MVINCAVATCKSTGKNSMSFHRFPQNRQLKQIWVQFCKRKDSFNAKTSRICSQHFENQYFIRDLKHELLNTPLKRRLQADAIPTIFNEMPISDRQKRKEQKERKQLVDQVLSGIINFLKLIAHVSLFLLKFDH